MSTITDDERATMDERIKSLYATELPTNEIIRRLGISYSRLYKVIDEAGIPRRGDPRRHSAPPDEQSIEARAEAVGLPSSGEALTEQASRSELTRAQIERQYNELPEATRQRIRDLRAGRHTDHAWSYPELMREFKQVNGVIARVLSEARQEEAEASVALDHVPEAETQIYDPEPPLAAELDLERLNADTGFATPQQPEPSAEALAEMPEVDPEKQRAAPRGGYALALERDQLVSQLRAQKLLADQRIIELEAENMRIKQEAQARSEELEHRLGEALLGPAPGAELDRDEPERGQHVYAATVLQYTIAERKLSIEANSFPEAMSKLADMKVLEIVRLSRADYDY